VLNTPASQRLQVQRYLAQGHRLTPLVAQRKFGCMRLGARVWELREDGWPIVSKLVDVGNGKRVAEYRIQPKGKKS
jgi:hypothetical protein